MERELGIMEDYYRLCNDNKSEPAVICYMFVISSTEPITVNQLKDSMAILVNRHPLLRMRIQKVNNKHIWREINTFTPDTMDITENPTDDWQTELSETVNVPFDLEHGPLWSIRILPNATCELFDESSMDVHHVVLAFRFSHTIADGLGK